MDLIYPSSTPFLGSKRSPWKFYFISLTLVALATTMSISSIVLSVTLWERSRSVIDGGNRLGGQGPRSTGSSAVCLPCSAILDASSSTEERMMSELYFAGHGFESTEEDAGIWSGNKDTCCARGRRQLRLLLRMFLNIRAKQHRDDYGTLERRRCLVFPSVERSVNGTRCILDKRDVAEAAHLTGARPGSSAGSSPSNDGSGTAGVLDWTTPSVLQGHVENTDGRLTCRSGGGVYFVYSQVYFVEYEDDIKTSGDDSTSSETISVYINRFVNQTRRTEVVTERSEGRCSRSTLTSASLCEYTVYAGSLVDLAAGDSVYVTVSHPSMVNDDAKVTYFGLQKVT